MLFWWFMLISDLLIPAIMLIAGAIMKNHCPKQINGLVEYRTSRSMKNMDTWQFAHNYCGRLWQKVGIIMLVPSLLVHIPFYHSDENAIGLLSAILMTVQCMVLIASVFPTESALKKTFFDDGTRR